MAEKHNLDDVGGPKFAVQNPQAAADAQRKAAADKQKTKQEHTNYVNPKLGAASTVKPGLASSTNFDASVFAKSAQGALDGLKTGLKPGPKPTVSATIEKNAPKAPEAATSTKSFADNVRIANNFNNQYEPSDRIAAARRIIENPPPGVKDLSSFKVLDAAGTIHDKTESFMAKKDTAGLKNYFEWQDKNAEKNPDSVAAKGWAEYPNMYPKTYEKAVQSTPEAGSQDRGEKNVFDTAYKHVTELTGGNRLAGHLAGIIGNTGADEKVRGACAAAWEAWAKVDPVAAVNALSKPMDKKGMTLGDYVSNTAGGPDFIKRANEAAHMVAGEPVTYPAFMMSGTWLNILRATDPNLSVQQQQAWAKTAFAEAQKFFAQNEKGQYTNNSEQAKQFRANWAYFMKSKNPNYKDVSMLAHEDFVKSVVGRDFASQDEKNFRNAFYAWQDDMDNSFIGSKFGNKDLKQKCIDMFKILAENEPEVAAQYLNAFAKIGKSSILETSGKTLREELERTPEGKKILAGLKAKGQTGALTPQQKQFMKEVKDVGTRSTDEKFKWCTGGNSGLSKGARDDVVYAQKFYLKAMSGYARAQQFMEKGDMADAQAAINGANNSMKMALTDIASARSQAQNMQDAGKIMNGLVVDIAVTIATVGAGSYFIAGKEGMTAAQMISIMSKIGAVSGGLGYGLKQGAIGEKITLSGFLINTIIGAVGGATGAGAGVGGQGLQKALGGGVIAKLASVSVQELEAFTSGVVSYATLTELNGGKIDWNQAVSAGMTAMATAAPAIASTVKTSHAPGAPKSILEKPVSEVAGEGFKLMKEKVSSIGKKSNVIPETHIEGNIQKNTSAKRIREMQEESKAGPAAATKKKSGLYLVKDTPETEQSKRNAQIEQKKTTAPEPAEQMQKPELTTKQQAVSDFQKVSGLSPKGKLFKYVQDTEFIEIPASEWNARTGAAGEGTDAFAVGNEKIYYKEGTDPKTVSQEFRHIVEQNLNSAAPPKTYREKVLRETWAHFPEKLEPLNSRLGYKSGEILEEALINGNFKPMEDTLTNSFLGDVIKKSGGSVTPESKAKMQVEARNQAKEFINNEIATDRILTKPISPQDMARLMSTEAPPIQGHVMTAEAMLSSIKEGAPVEYYQTPDKRIFAVVETKSGQKFTIQANAPFTAANGKVFLWDPKTNSLVPKGVAAVAQKPIETVAPKATAPTEKSAGAGPEPVMEISHEKAAPKITSISAQDMANLMKTAPLHTGIANADKFLSSIQQGASVEYYQTPDKRIFAVVETPNQGKISMQANTPFTAANGKVFLWDPKTNSLVPKGELAFAPKAAVAQKPIETPVAKAPELKPPTPDELNAVAAYSAFKKSGSKESWTDFLGGISKGKNLKLYYDEVAAQKGGAVATPKPEALAGKNIQKNTSEAEINKMKTESQGPKRFVVSLSPDEMSLLPNEVQNTLQTSLRPMFDNLYGYNTNPTATIYDIMSGREIVPNSPKGTESFPGVTLTKNTGYETTRGGNIVRVDETGYVLSDKYGKTSSLVQSTKKSFTKGNSAVSTEIIQNYGPDGKPVGTTFVKSTAVLLDRGGQTVQNTLIFTDATGKVTGTAEYISNKLTKGSTPTGELTLKDANGNVQLIKDGFNTKNSENPINAIRGTAINVEKDNWSFATATEPLNKLANDYDPRVGHKYRALDLANALSKTYYPLSTSLLPKLSEKIPGLTAIRDIGIDLHSQLTQPGTEGVSYNDQNFTGFFIEKMETGIKAIDSWNFDALKPQTKSAFNEVKSKFELFKSYQAEQQKIARQYRGRPKEELAAAYGALDAKYGPLGATPSGLARAMSNYTTYFLGDLGKIYNNALHGVQFPK